MSSRKLKISGNVSCKSRHDKRHKQQGPNKQKKLRRGGKNTQNCTNHSGVVTHLTSDILECEVKWVLGSITTNKASGEDGIPAELFQILKDDAVKVLHSICQQIWKTQQWSRDWKRSVFIPIPKKGSAKACSDYPTSGLISHASKVILNIFKLGFHSS